MSEDILLSKWKAAKEKLDAASEAIDEFESLVHEFREEHAKRIESLKLPFLLPEVDHDRLRAFLKQPYVIILRRGNTYYLVVPSWVPLQLGWSGRLLASIFSLSTSMFDGLHLCRQRLRSGSDLRFRPRWKL